MNPVIPSVDQAVPELRDLSASASRVLGLKMCATSAPMIPSVSPLQEKDLSTQWCHFP